MISSEIEISEKINIVIIIKLNVIMYFSNIVKELNIKVEEGLLCDVSNINDLVERSYSEIQKPS